MQLVFDQRLTDPTEAAVRDAIKKACAAANGKRRTGAVNLSDQSRAYLAKRVLGEPEGSYTPHGARSRTGTTMIRLVWWTAPGKRKLVRVSSGRGDGPPPNAHYSDPYVVRQHELQRRPVIWRMDPEQITIVETDGVTECVAVCGCGAAGSPESLAWAGGMCGPCRDRVEELGPDAVPHVPTVFTDPEFDPQRVAFTADGKRIVAVGGNAFRIWDRATGELLASGEGAGNLAVDLLTTDGRFAVLCEEHGVIVCRDLETGRQHVWGEGVDPRVMFATGRPGEVVVQLGHFDRTFLRLSLNTDTQTGAALGPPTEDAVLCAVHPDAKSPRVAFTDYGYVSVCRFGRKGEFESEHSFRLGVGAHQRTGNWGDGPKLVRFTADGERLLFVSSGLPAEHLELWNPAKPKALLQVTFPARVLDAQFSPDGDHLFILGEGGDVFVCHPGLLTHVRARLRWHTGPATSLAVSPDGKTLATTGHEGVKLWPVARLLEVL